MEKISVQKQAEILRVMVRAVFVLNVIIVVLVPYLIMAGRDMGGIGGFFTYLYWDITEFFRVITRPDEVELYMPFLFWLILSWCAVWSELYAAALTAFFLTCGVCTMLILRQAQNVLDTILAQKPFQPANAEALGKCARYCWIISAAALAKLVLWLWKEKTLAPLTTYTALFIPAFLMAGLLFRIMSALFRQAAELREDQDLTI